ncbi:LytR family transcriptional regulator [Streptomyces sp. SID8379]|uniref:LCP family protein n=1 Tax=unclassified Streptomyces TaxID=2593676 RepID=UPI00037411C5|nr:MULTISPECIES: LCP family protein [unclassified Streptomyces]MYW63770.1 LytR family transcriptional regulator [Streptomyces sp. SID8379]
MRNVFLRAGRRGVALGALALGLLTFSSVAIGQAADSLPKQVDVFGGLGARPADGSGTNILLMGTDGRDTITRSEKEKFHAGGVACNCSDTMMLVHLSEQHDRVSVVSLPRDSYAEIPEHDAGDGTVRERHPAKINAAYAEGGPTLAVQTVESMTGVRIDHYLQIDFRRFMDSVNAVDGVTVCTSRRLSDSATKLNLGPGRHHLAGGPALQYVRSRHVDTSADLGRVQRQQRFLVNALRGAGMRTALSDPSKAAGLARTVLGSASVDQGFSVNDLVSLARDLNRIPLSRTEFGTVPIDGFNPLIENVGSTLRWDQGKAEQLFSRIQEDRPVTEPGSHTEPLDPPRLNVQTFVHGDKLACK